MISHNCSVCGEAVSKYCAAHPKAIVDSVVDTVKCECGEAGGDAECAWTGPRAETVRVEYMPESLRGSHAAAGNSGRYPANGSILIRCEQTCADRIVADNDGWASIVL